MRWNCADHAVRGYGSSLSSMSRMASASEFRSFWMRSNCRRVFAVAVGEIVLQCAQARDLPCDVPRVGHHGRQRDDQSQEQASRVGDADRRALHAPRI